MKEQIKNNEKEKTYKIRLLREINNGLINIKTVRKSTLEKYNIKLDEQTNKYISAQIETYILLIIMYL
jgi:hypothetical protein